MLASADYSVEYLASQGEARRCLSRARSTSTGEFASLRSGCCSRRRSAGYLGAPLFVSRAVNEASPNVVPGTASGTSGLAARGPFGILDTIHPTQGTASVFRLPDGTRVLRLEEFMVTAPRTKTELHDVRAFEVAAVKGNVGDQNYVRQADLDLQDFKSVVIYCRRFGVIFSSAPLTLEGVPA
jgi:electron transfer DM13